MKRRIHATVTLEYWVDLDIDDEEQVCADPDGEMSDADAGEHFVIKFSLAYTCRIITEECTYHKVIGYEC